jgi:hypothetical protein
MVQIISHRFSPLFPPPYRGSGELWGLKSPEIPINGEKRGIMGKRESRKVVSFSGECEVCK